MQNNSRKLSLTEITGNYIEATYNWEAPPGIVEAIKFGYEAALAQQAQPRELTDLEISTLALAVFNADGPDARGVVRDILARAVKYQ